jgi:hypothetical protein
MTVTGSRARRVIFAYWPGRGRTRRSASGPPPGRCFSSCCQAQPRRSWPPAPFPRGKQAPADCSGHCGAAGHDEVRSAFLVPGVLWGHRVVDMLARRSRQAAAFARQAERRGSRLAGLAVLLSAFLPVPSPPGLRGGRLGRPAPRPVHRSRSHRLGDVGGAARCARISAGHQRHCRAEPRLALCANGGFAPARQVMLVVGEASDGARAGA